MNYLKTIFLIIILDLVLANSDINIWNLKTSTINLLLYKAFYEKVVFNETRYGKNIYIQKVIYRNENQIKNETKIIIDNKQEMTTDQFENIQTFYYLQDIYYICLKENNIYVSDYVGSLNYHGLIKETPTSERNLKCYCKDGDDKIYFVFLNSYKDNLIYLTYLDEKNTISCNKSKTNSDEIYDFFAYSPINSTIFYMNMILLENKHICLYNITIDAPYMFANKTIDLIYNANYYSHRYLYFYKETKIFYFMLYNTVFDFTSGYSLNEIGEEINNNKNIKIYTNSESPLKIFGDSKIYYLKFIRNTRFAYYKIEASNTIIYHGILDIKLNKIIFNTNDYIKEFRPLTNYSMLAITNDSAYEICPFTQEDKCIEDCEEGQELIINYEKGNYCAKPTSYNSHNFNYLIIIGIVLLLLLTILIVVFYIKRRKKCNSIEMINGKKMNLFDPIAREKD